MTDQNLTETLDAYLSSRGSVLTDAEKASVAALKLTARTLDAQDEPVASLLSTYMRELARFQKGHADKPVDPLAAALDNLTANDQTTPMDG